MVVFGGCQTGWLIKLVGDGGLSWLATVMFGGGHHNDIHITTCKERSLLERVGNFKNYTN